MKHETITQAVIGAFYDVYNALGYGFLEKVYENAMAIEIRRRAHTVACQYPIAVSYRDQIVGDYYADLLIDDAVIVELKAVRALAKQHEAQLLNYLSATPYEVGLLLNFGPEPKFIRKVFDNDRKRYLAAGSRRSP